MSPRSIRRAAERKRKKLELKLAREHAAAAAGQTMAAGAGAGVDCDLIEPDPISDPAPLKEKRPISAAQLAANRANAQLSSGPTSPQGKAISSRNHFKHGFRGEFCVLPSENQDEFDELLAAFREEHQPSTPSEEATVEQLAKHLWLSRRAGRLLDEALTSGDDPREQQKSIALYLRYEASNDRGFSKSLNDLLRIRAQKFREQIGFERQQQKALIDAQRLKQKQAAEARKQELHDARVRTANAKAEYLEQKTKIEEDTQTRSPEADPKLEAIKSAKGADARPEAGEGTRCSLRGAEAHSRLVALCAR